MRKSLRSLIGLTTVLAIATAGVSAAGAVTPTGPPEFIGWSGGTEVIGLGGAVTSNLTAGSNLDTIKTGAAVTNSLATASAPGLLSVGAISSSEQSQAVTGGVQIVSHAQTAGVSLLGGLITADLVSTTANASLINNAVGGGASTTFTNLKIAGAVIPLTVAKNFGVTIPGVATVLLNVGYSVPGSQAGTVNTDGAALYISLLNSLGSNPVGTQIWVNPVHAGLAIGVASSGIPIGGFAYGTKISAAVGTVLNVGSGPTAYNVMPATGTHGQNVTATTASLNLPGVAGAGTIYTIANGTSSATAADAKETVAVAGLNLFGGLITADSLKGYVEANLAGGKVTLTATTTLVNLKVAGAAIPINVAPNTVIQVANLGAVTINAQAKGGAAVGVRVLDIKLSSAAFGLPVGAEIEIGTAAVYV
jgi:hypothetical protein